MPRSAVCLLVIVAFACARGERATPPPRDETRSQPPRAAGARPPSSLPRAAIAQPTPYVHPIYRFAHGDDLRPERNPAVAPRPVSTPAPKYPDVATRARVHGTVILELVIDRNGRVVRGRVLKPLPFGLDQAAVEAVRDWRYRPARDGNGNPVASIVNVTIEMQPPAGK
jgi:protein TonB